MPQGERKKERTSSFVLSFGPDQWTFRLLRSRSLLRYSGRNMLFMSSPLPLGGSSEHRGEQGHPAEGLCVQELQLAPWPTLSLPGGLPASALAGHPGHISGPWLFPGVHSGKWSSPGKKRLPSASKWWFICTEIYVKPYFNPVNTPDVVYLHTLWLRNCNPLLPQWWMTSCWCSGFNHPVQSVLTAESSTDFENHNEKNPLHSKWECGVSVPSSDFFFSSSQSDFDRKLRGGELQRDTQIHLL